MYLAGALHDIGKMAVGNEILEKPDKLTDDEFSTMKNHAGYTYLILSEVNDFEEIRDWAAFHHEKLNGNRGSSGSCGGTSGEVPDAGLPEFFRRNDHAGDCGMLTYPVKYRKNPDAQSKSIVKRTIGGDRI